ncbi:MAG: response regulator [Candidatus Omnitrophota bacterium]
MSVIKVLIIEDEDVLRELMASELGSRGYEIVQAADGRQGMKICEESRPDIVLTDVLMPESDGNQFFKELRASDWGKEIPVIVVTARSAMRDYFEAVNVDGFIEKPFEMDDLAAMIERVLAPEAGGEATGQKKSGSGVKVKGRETSGGAVQDEAEKILDHSILDVEEKSVPRTELSDKTDSKKKEDEYRKCVFLLEDEPLFVKMLSLSMDKIRVGVVSSGERFEFLQKLEDREPAVIIMKHFINDFNTEELADQLKSKPRYFDIPILIYDTIGCVESSKDGAEFVFDARGKELIKSIKKQLL